jgi:CBS domain containing-hemolysin-like protein
MLALLLALVCVAANGFFVAAEFALAKVRPTALEAMAAQGDGKAALALSLTRRLDAYLTATQLGITFASLGLGWLGEPAIAGVLEPALHRFDLSPEVVRIIGLTVAFSIITVLHIVVGELIPKSLAIQLPEDTARHTALLLKGFYFAVWPVLWALNGVSNLALRALGLPPAEHAEGKLSVEEIRLIVRASIKDEGSDKKKREIIERVLRGIDRPVRAIMVPRVDIVTLSLSHGLEACLETARRHGYSRYPVCESGELDEIDGYLYVKDLMMTPTGAPETLLSRKRDLPVFAESLSVGDILVRFQSSAVPIGLIVDEYGGTAGLVTLEDAMEAIVGQLRDELDKEAPQVSVRDDGTVVVDPRVSTHDLQLSGFEPRTEQGETVGATILSALGRLPHPGDTVPMGAYEAIVDEVRHRRISRVLLRPRTRTPPPVSADDTPKPVDGG